MRADSAVVTAPVPTRSSRNFSNHEHALAVRRTSAAFMGNCMPAERIQYLTSQISSAYLFIAILKLILSRRGPLFFRDIVHDGRTQRFLVLWGEAPPPLIPTGLDTKTVEKGKDAVVTAHWSTQCHVCKFPPLRPSSAPPQNKCQPTSWTGYGAPSGFSAKLLYGGAPAKYARR